MAETEKSAGSDNTEDILAKIENKSLKIESLIKQLKFLILIQVSHLKYANWIGVRKALMAIKDVEGILRSLDPQYYDILM
ncbi:hypothetical protein Goshw_009040, partial [Gossypium schwendimanii]|nr:hypothetical protein [Gossypium schwendimanii]